MSRSDQTHADFQYTTVMRGSLLDTYGDYDFEEGEGSLVPSLSS